MRLGHGTSRKSREGRTRNDKACRDMAREFGGVKFLAAELGMRFPDRTCEGTSIGENSPGEVALDERLFRLR